MKKSLKRIFTILLSGMLVIPMLLVPASAAEPLTVTGLTCEHMTDPLGIDTQTPVFGWKLESTQRGVLQKSYRILVASDREKLAAGEGDLWDSGEVEGGDSTAVSYGGRQFAPATAYYWCVTVTDNHGNRAQSAPAVFETALLSENDWQGAQWINGKPADAAAHDGVYYVYEADFQIVNGGASFVFGYQDGQNFYMWQVGTSGGHPALRPHLWWKGNIWLRAPEVDISEIMRDWNGRHHMKIEFDNGLITTAIDGVQVDSRNMNNDFGLQGEPLVLPAGKVGFRAGDAVEEAYYDNVSLYDGDGVISFRDDFNDAVVQNFDGAVIEDGRLHVRQNGGQQIFVPATPDTSRYTLSGDFRIDRQAASFVFGATDSGNNYTWQINTVLDGKIQLRPHRWKNGGAATLADVDISGILTQETLHDWHHIEIRVDGRNVTTLLDGKQADSRTLDEAVPFGLIGFRQVRDAEWNEQASYDNVTLTDANGRVIFHDNFENPARVSFDDGKISDGCLVFDGSQEKTFIFRQAETLTDEYIVSLDFAIEEASAGIIFGAQDRKNYYMWQVNANMGDGKVWLRPHVCINGNYVILPNVDVSAQMPWESVIGAVHTMQLRVSGGTIETYFDGVRVSVVTNVEFRTPGWVGFRLYKEQGLNERMSCGYIRVEDRGGNVLFCEEFDDASTMQFESGSVKDGRGYFEMTDAEAIFPRGIDEEVNAPLLRRNFTVEREIVSARLYAAALGLYETYLNGQKVGEDYLAPGWTDYNDRVQYQTYDVTSLLRQGENVWGAILGNGWYSGNVHNWGNHLWGDTPAFIGQLRITYTDGSVQTLVTDDSFRLHTGSPIVANDILDGETYDATKELGGSPNAWATAEVSSDGWAHAGIADENRHLIAQVDPAIHNTMELTTQKVTKTDRDATGAAQQAYIFDLGQNFAGVIRLTLHNLTPGQKLTLRYGEMLNQDGTLYIANLRTAEATDVYIARGGETEVYVPRFTYHGFQYVEITGLKAAPEADMVTGLVLNSDTPELSTFETSSAMLNQLQSNILWGLRSNYVSVPTDCPQRDERLGWTDHHEVAKTALYNYDSYAFYRKWLADIRQAQNPDGEIIIIAPANPNLHFDGHAGWQDTAVILPWTLYKTYGDTAIITENYEMMTRYVDYCITDCVEGKPLIRRPCYFGDWLQVDADTPKDVLSTAFFAYSAQLLSEMAEIIGSTADAAKYAKLHDDIAQAFCDEFVSADGAVGNGTQACYIFALKMGLLPEAQRTEAAGRLAADIKARGHLTTGFVSTGYLCPMLSEYGYTDVAYSLLLSEGYPSWGYTIKNGANTMWERWDSYTIENGFGDVSMNSFNHINFGSIGEWMYQYMGGIRMTDGDVGYDHFLIAPELGSGVTFCRTSTDTVRGTIRSDWSCGEDGSFRLSLSVPAGSTATMRLPFGNLKDLREGGKDVATETIDGIRSAAVEDGRIVVELGSGDYEFLLAAETQEPSGGSGASEPSEPSEPSGGEPDEPKPAEDGKPRTGDSGKPILWLATAGLTLAACGMLLACTKRRKKD